MSQSAAYVPGRVHVRTPTYQRPKMLRHALASLLEQTHQDWVCDVRDDCPDASARTIVEGFGDPRIRHVHNLPQKFASDNINACFSRDNPERAEFFCVVEDDNVLFPRFMERGIAFCRTGVEIVQFNQAIEHDSGTAAARFGKLTTLSGTFREGTGRVPAEVFRLAILGAIGCSNGGLFWSVRARSDLMILSETTATLQEYLRTFNIVEPVMVSMEPMAVWADNGAQTTRNNDISTSYLRREMDLKRSIIALQRDVWRVTPENIRAAFLAGDLLAIDARNRAIALTKSLLRPFVPGLGPRDRVRNLMRGPAIVLGGTVHPSARDAIRRYAEKTSHDGTRR